MNWDLKRYGFAIGAATLVAAMHLPAQAAQTEITGAQLTPSGKGFELTLQTQGNKRPPIFTVNRGNASVADISNAQLRLPSGQTFSQPKPAPGIESIEMRQLDANTVRITVQGTQSAPVSDTVRRDERQGLLVLRFNAIAAGDGLSTNNTPSSGQSPNAVPPFRSRAIAPPVGDIAVGAINAEAESIELNNAQVIPKLLLRNAPVREVLTLLGRSANVNVAFSEGETASEPGKAGSGAGDSGSTISLDIENESVQDVFNYVLRLSGLQANKVGNTIFVGKNLPGDAQNRIVRTLRLNQLRATAKITFNNALVGTSQVGGSVSGGTGSVTSSGGDASASISGGSTGSASASALSRISKYSEEYKEKGAKEILESYGANNGGGGTGPDAETSNIDLLKGLQVVADARLNSVTLIGTPRKVAMATNIIQQLDLRKRQTAVNVKIVDINLDKTKNFDSNLSFTAPGASKVGFGFGAATSGIGNALGIVFGGGAGPVTITSIANSLVGSLVANVTNGNSKILTDPTLIVQEGSSAQVNLTTEVFSGFSQTTTTTAVSGSTAATPSTSITPIIRQAGVIFNVTVDRIDDNGFISLSVSPEVSSVFSTYNFVFPGSSQSQTGSLLNQRRLETGKVRLRDGQTLVLSGIIQDTDKTTISKVPILGDIPLLGRLFRKEAGERAHNELVVLVTPRILDDSDQAATGYQYSPSPDAQQLLNK